MPSGRFQLLDGCRSLRWWEWVLGVVMTVVPLIGGFLGAKLFNTGIYKSGALLKPDWAPPPWLFSPAWTILYLLMGLASFLLVKLGGGLHADTAPPLLLYTLQLLLNWTWTPLFFGMYNFNMAGMVLGAVLGLTVGCVVTFLGVTRVGAGLLVPYVAWLLYAGALNYAIVQLNGPYLNFTSPTI